MRSVLDDLEPIRLTKRVDSRHVAWLSAHVHWDNNLGQVACLVCPCKFVGKFLHTHAVGAWINVDEVDIRTAV